MDRDSAMPLVTTLTRDVVVHDLAADAAAVLSGVFVPDGPQVLVEVQAAISFLGNSRGALLLYVSQAVEPGARLHDAGAAPLPGVSWYSVASVNGECAWANTTSRRLVLDVEPGRPLTWQILAAIIGGAATVDVPGAGRMAITPDGVTALVCSPAQGLLTPIALGRPGYSYDQRLPGMDEGLPPLPVDRPTHVSAGDTYAVVSGAGARPQLSIVSVPERAVLRQVEVAGGVPLGAGIAADESFAVVGTDGGTVLRVALPSGETVAAQIGGELVDAAVLSDGSAAYVADAAGRAVHRLGLPDLAVEASLALAEPPQVLRVAPDGRLWVLCRPAPPAPGRLLGVDPATNRVLADFELPFAGPLAMALVPVRGQASDVVRTAWVVFDGGRYCEFNIGGEFAGQVHSFHNGAFGEGVDAAAVAVNDYGEIWVTQPSAGHVYKWIGGRLQCRAGLDRPHPGIIFGEYCEVLVYGARREPGY